MFIMSGKTGSNITYPEEKDFSIIPDVRVWTGEIPWKQGEKFPPSDVLNRASKYLAYKKLYQNKYDEAFNSIYDIQSMQNDPFGYSQVYDLSLNIPDFRNCTESWVDLMAAIPPRIDGESDEIDKLSSLLTNSNFNEQFKSIIRNNIIYGNKIIKVNKCGDNIRLTDMRVTNWIPFVDEDDYSFIRVNLFFNIITDKEGDICEFISYDSDGTIIKKTFRYNKNSQTLGECISTEKSESFLGETPIVVFSENSLDGILGESSYELWESAIASSIRAYNNLMTMLQRAKEAILVIPNYASETDEGTDQRILIRKGAIEYSPGTEHDVKYVTADLDLENAIEAYKETLARLSRDTDLSMGFFDSKVFGAYSSAKALRLSLFRTELKAKSRVSALELNTKDLIIKIGKAYGLDISKHDFSLLVNVGFVNDEETQLKVIQSRCGNKVTMSVEDAIAAYDNVSMRRAKAKANELVGIKEDNEDVEDIEDNISGSRDNIDFTAQEITSDSDNTVISGNSNTGVAFVL